jgi:hypothetical protein
VYSGQHRVGEAQLVERFAVVIERNHPGNLLAESLHLRTAQRISSGLGSQLESVTRLPRLDSNLPLIIAVQAKSHPHDPVEAALVAMPEAHHRDLVQIKRTHDV